MRLLQCASSQAAREYIRVPHFVGVVFCYRYLFIIHHMFSPKLHMALGHEIPVEPLELTRHFAVTIFTVLKWYGHFQS